MDVTEERSQEVKKELLAKKELWDFLEKELEEFEKIKKSLEEGKQ